MVYVLIVFIGLLIITYVQGMSDCISLEVFMEIRTMKSPYYTIGMSFNPDVDGVYDELVFGLFFINLVFVFYKKQE